MIKNKVKMLTPLFCYVIIQTVLAATDDAGEKLILTPLIEANNLEEARNASKVNYADFGNITSYSGYLTVNETYNSNLFFWFFQSQNSFQKDPLILWLSGGPGESSLFALFNGNGPFIVNDSLKVTFRTNSWTKHHSVLYIDNPVGAGFSFTNADGYAQNETKIGEDLYGALLQFFKLFPELQKNDFFIAGESYASKYLPAIGHKIATNNQSAGIKIPLKGLLIGSVFSDPETQVAVYGNHLYQLGLIDLNGRQVFEQYQADIVTNIKEKKFVEAFGYFKTLMNGLQITPTIYENLTGLTSIFNYAIESDPYGYDFLKLINTTALRKTLHAGNQTFGANSPTLIQNLITDILDSVRPWIEGLLPKIKILFFNGQLDVVCPYTGTINMIENLNFSSAAEYKAAPRKIWHVNNKVAGYCKTAGNLTECMVRNAGHRIPQDQPENTYDLVYRFVRNTL